MANSSNSALAIASYLLSSSCLLSSDYLYKSSRNLIFFCFKRSRNYFLDRKSWIYFLLWYPLKVFWITIAWLEKYCRFFLFISIARLILNLFLVRIPLIIVYILIVAFLFSVYFLSNLNILNRDWILRAILLSLSQNFSVYYT